MGALPVQPLVNAGTPPTFTTPSVSDTAAYGNGSNTFAVYFNTDGSPHTVTITVPGNNSYGKANPAATYVLAATTGKAWIPLRREYDNLAGGAPTGTATLTLDAVTGVTVAVVQVL